MQAVTMVTNGYSSRETVDNNMYLLDYNHHYDQSKRSFVWSFIVSSSTLDCVDLLSNPITDTRLVIGQMNLLLFTFTYSKTVQELTILHLLM
jgi:hypothetical protein